MRLEGQAKSGFYPLPPRWINPIAEAIRCKPSSTLFDPCCGKADAVKALGNSLCIPPKNVYGAEMDEGRSAEAVGKLADGRFFGPVDFLGSSAYGLASIVYVNPPFDNELGGGGRVEWRFLMKSIECCIPGGLLIAVLPESVAMDYRTWELLSSCMYRTKVFHPPGERPFKECVLIAHKRRTLVETSYRDRCSPQPLEAAVQYGYAVGAGGPVSVRKAFYTEQEIEQLTKSSVCNEVLKSASYRGRAKSRPPMNLTKGHIALLLASGCLDGVVEADGQPPHVVRGSSRKAIEEKTYKDDGKVKVVRTEQIHLTVKTVDEHGDVKLLTNKIENEVIEEEETEESDVELANDD
jgi:hypothetical protein